MKITLPTPHMSDEGYEKEYIKEAFDTNWIAPLGKNVTEFENEMVKFLGAKEAVALSSGTASIHLGLKMLGVKQGDIVFCQSFTFSGSCNPIAYCGAKPVYIDSEITSGNMSPIALKKAYEKYPNPKAVIIVDLYGTPANYDELLPIIKEHNTPILEDAAEALGGKYKGVYLGLYGDCGVLSFNGNKIITTSGGGMLLVNNKEQKDKVVYWSTQSREKCLWYEHKEIGYNYCLSNVLAGIGRGQLKVLQKRVDKKREIYATYKKCFEGCKYLTMFGEQADSEPNRWLSVISLKNTKVKAMELIDYLFKNEVETRPAWKPMHMQPVFKDCDFFSEKQVGSTCQDIFESSICLPSDTKTDLKDIEFVAKLIIDYLEKNS